MGSIVQNSRRICRCLLAGLAACLVSASTSLAGDGAAAPDGVCPSCHKPLGTHHKHPGPPYGTLGYGPPGIHAGFQGFGLGYHPGYGYGGQALGVGAEGGYPFYGGPGYPHPWPVLRRFSSITPFPFYGGPGGPSPGHPNYFGGVGPLAPDQPVVAAEPNPNDPPYTNAYGNFTGMVPYPERTFAPFVTIAATGGSSSGVSTSTPGNAPPNTAPAPGEMLDEHAGTRSLGIDAEAVFDPDRGWGLKVTRIYPGRAGEKAGLRLGDVIRSINGYATEQPSHLAWIIAKAAPGKVLKMNVRSANEGQDHTVTVPLP